MSAALIVSICAMVVGLSSLIVAIKAYRRGGPRVKATVRSVREVTDPERALVVTLKVSNTGLAEVDIRRMMFNLNGATSELLPWDIQDGRWPSGSRIKPGSTIEFEVDVLVPLAHSLIQQLGPAVRDNRVLMRRYLREILRTGFRRNWTKPIVLELGNGGTAEIEKGHKLLFESHDTIRWLLTHPDPPALEKELRERQENRLKFMQQPKI